MVLEDPSRESLSLEQEASYEKTAPERLDRLAKDSIEGARGVAQNLAAPAELLRKLSQHEERAVREAVTANPNTPTEILFELGAEFPEQLLENPVFPLLWLEHPNLVEAIPSETLSRLLARPCAPIELLEQTANHPSPSIRYLLERILNDRNCSIDLLVRFSQSSYADIRRAVAANLNTPPSVLEVLGGDRADDIRRIVAGNPQTPPSVLERLASDRSKDIRRAVGYNGQTPPSVLEMLAGDRVETIRCAVAINRQTPPSVLEVLASDLADEVRRAVAGNPQTPVATLVALARDRNHAFVVSSVAKNPQTPVSVLEMLASSEDGSVRLCLVGNPHVPISVLETLARDPKISIKSAVACQPQTPFSLVESILRDNPRQLHYEVARYAGSAAVLEQLARSPYPAIRQALTQNPKTPVSVLEKLAGDEQMEVRLGVAQHRETPATALQDLARDRYLKVRLGVANHANAPIEILQMLAEDRIGAVCSAARQRLQAVNIEGF